jgi:hypothetical protein
LPLQLDEIAEVEEIARRIFREELAKASAVEPEVTVFDVEPPPPPPQEDEE